MDMVGCETLAKGEPHAMRIHRTPDRIAWHARVTCGTEALPCVMMMAAAAYCAAFLAVFINLPGILHAPHPLEDQLRDQSPSLQKFWGNAGELEL